MREADTIKEVAPVWAILEAQMRLGKGGRHNVSLLDDALCHPALIMNIFNDKAVNSPLLFSARLNFLLASAALMRPVESKSSLLTGGSPSLPLRDAPA